MKKEITLCDSCGQEIGAAVRGFQASDNFNGAGEGSKRFSFGLQFHAMAHGMVPRAQMRPGTPPDLCVTCALAIVENALKEAPAEASTAA